METDLDIIRCAQLMIARHGSDAEAEAAQNASRMISTGDKVGAVVWKRITSAIMEMRQTTVAASSARRVLH